jgi:histidyl-tRNA synthetase
MSKKSKTKKKIKKPIRKPKKVKIRVPEAAKAKGPQSLRGMKDILPDEQKYWVFVEKKAKKFASGYGFFRIDTPILEAKNLFVRAVGAHTDIIEKEIFSFTDRSGEEMCLRPEATASVARAYIQHGMVNLPQPVKLFCTGPRFRHDRPQAGRLREFHQFDFDVLGDSHPVVDAELILLAFNFCKELGLKISIQINSIGCASCRSKYVAELVNYYRTNKKLLCESCKKRLIKNPLRLLDCKEEKCQSVKEEAPQIVDWLCDDCKNHFVKVLEYLDEVGAPYNLNPYLVRGLDYYTKTVFEIFPEEEAAERQDALGGGGRYDDLIKFLGGRPTPACGFALGIERLILAIKRQNLTVPELEKPTIFLAQLGENARRRALVLFEELRAGGIYAASNFSKEGIKAQLEIANKLGVKFVLILGQKEVVDGTIIIKDMESGVQEVIDFKKAAPEIKKKLMNVSA